MNPQFFRGTDLEDPNGLLAGSGKSARHVKVRDASEVEGPEVGELIRQAAELARADTD